MHFNVKADVDWIRKSPWFACFDVGFLKYSSMENQKNYLRAICFFDAENPYLKIDRKRLLSDAEADANLSEKTLLKLFADGLENYLGKESATLLSEAYRHGPIFDALVDTLIQLHRSPPEECPIQFEKLEELLQTFLIGQLAVAKQNSMEENSFYHRSIIENLKIGEKIMLPALLRGHAISIEVYRLESDSYDLTILNSGFGVHHHRDMVSNDVRRVEFFHSIRQNREEMAKKSYFYSRTLLVDQFYEALPDRVLTDRLSELKLVDTYSLQKNSNCTAKSAMLMIKWLTRREDAVDKYGHYLWFKAWHISYRAKDLRRMLSSRVVTKEKLKGLEKKWEGLNVSLDSLDEATSEAEVIILHHVMRILSDAKKLKDESLRQAIIVTLQSVELQCAHRDLFETALN